MLTVVEEQQLQPATTQGKKDPSAPIWIRLKEKKQVPRRPTYPSLGTTVWHFVHLCLIHQCLLGALLVYFATPLYRWTRVVARDKWDLDDAVYFTAMLSGLHTAMFLLVNAPYFVCDRLKLCQWAKLHRKPHMETSSEQLKKLGKHQLVSQLISTPIGSYFAYPIFFRHVLLDLDDDAAIPTIQESFVAILVQSLVFDVVFYFTHQLLHNNKWLYKHVHKQHHEFVGSVGYAAEYAHPLEGLLSNHVPLLVGLALVARCHPLCFFVYVSIRLQETYETHSGYRCGFFFFFRFRQEDEEEEDGVDGSSSGGFLRFFSKEYQVAHHDFHHTHNRGNFGSYWIDWLFGTMDHYQAIRGGEGSPGGFEGYMQLKKAKRTV